MTILYIAMHQFASLVAKTEKKNLLVGFLYGLNKSLMASNEYCFVAHCKFHCIPVSTNAN